MRDAKNDLFNDMTQVDDLMQKEELENAKMRKRMMWLIPYNFAIIWGTLRYCYNIKNIANKYWPSHQKVRVSNLLLISTVQALGFTAIYLGGSFAIVGVNPVKRYRELREASSIQQPLVPLEVVGDDGKPLELQLTPRQD